MTKQELETIGNVIREVVNGKIDRLTQKVDDHNEKHEADMAEVKKHINATKPIVEAYQGGKAIGGFVKWFAGVGVAWLLIQGWLTGKI